MIYLKAKTVLVRIPNKLINQKTKNQNMNPRKTLLCIVAILCLRLSAFAQGELKTLHVGDRLPESFWSQQHQIYEGGKVATNTLTQYKDKLIIIDFWATWCGSCLKKFPLLDSMQTTFKEEVVIVLVNAKKSKDNAARVMQKLASYNFVSVLNDTTLSLNFPHSMLPHYIWVHNGRVFSITDSALINWNVLNTVIARYREIKNYNKPKITQP